MADGSALTRLRQYVLRAREVCNTISVRRSLYQRRSCARFGPENRKLASSHTAASIFSSNISAGAPSNETSSLWQDVHLYRVGILDGRISLWCLNRLRSV